MKPPSGIISELEIQFARKRVEDALQQLLDNFPEDLPNQGPWWLEPNSSEGAVLRYSSIFGRDHLAEVATGLSHDQNRSRYSGAELCVDFNGAAGLNGMMLVQVGLAESLIVVDHCPAAGVVALQLAEILGIDCTYHDVTSFEKSASFEFPHKSIFLLASHAQNVLFFNDEADAALENQNRNLMQALQKSFPDLESLSAISLEPARGLRGLNDLLNPFQENYEVQSYSHVPVAKFGRGLRVGHKKFESAILTKVSVSL